MSKLKELYDVVVKFKAKLLFKFASDAVKAQVAVKLLEELYKSRENTLSETSVAIVASGLGLKTSAKRKSTSRKKPSLKGKKKSKKKKTTKVKKK